MTTLEMLDNSATQLALARLTEPNHLVEFRHVFANVVQSCIDPLFRRYLSRPTGRNEIMDVIHEISRNPPIENALDDLQSISEGIIADGTGSFADWRVFGSAVGRTLNTLAGWTPQHTFIDNDIVGSISNPITSLLNDAALLALLPTNSDTFQFASQHLADVAAEQIERFVRELYELLNDIPPKPPILILTETDITILDQSISIRRTQKQYFSLLWTLAISANHPLRRREIMERTGIRGEQSSLSTVVTRLRNVLRPAILAACKLLRQTPTPLQEQCYVVSCDKLNYNGYILGIEPNRVKIIDASPSWHTGRGSAGTTMQES